MSKKGGVKIELDGQEFKDLIKMLDEIPGELGPSAVRAVARKPGNRIVAMIRKLFTRKDTGISKRSFGILPVKDKKQRFIEVGIKGKSLAYIWLFFKGGERKKDSGASTGRIKPFGNLFEKAAEMLGSTVMKDMQVNLNSIIKRVMRKHKAR
jgi:hypothetical protein